MLRVFVVFVFTWKIFTEPSPETGRDHKLPSDRRGAEFYKVTISNCNVTTLKRSLDYISFIKSINPFLFANERTEMKLKIYLSEAWMCSEFGMLLTDVERERVNSESHRWHYLY